MEVRSLLFEVRLMKVFAFAVLLCLFASVNAQVINTQPYRADARAGNKEYEKGNYADAEANYKKALDKKNNMPEAIFNLGNAMYAQKRYDEALKQFQLAAQTNPDTAVKAKAYHNIGNVYLQQEKWEDAVKAYKSALKLKHTDPETKYNLAYANAKLKQEKGEGGQNSQQQKKDQQDKKNEQQKQDQNKDKQGEDKNKQGQNSDGDKKEDKNREPKQGSGQQPKLSKEEAEQMLKALTNEEQKTNQKVQQKQVKVSNIKIEKDW